MKIKIAEQKDKLRWDDFVKRQQEASPYHLFAWKEAVEKSYGYKGYYLYAELNDQIVGIFPLIHFRVPLRANSLVALPYCDLGKPVALTEGVAQKLVEDACRLADKLGVKILDIRGSIPEASLPADDNLQCQEFSGKVRMVLDLPASAADLWKDFKSKLRSQIRKSEKNGLVFCWGGERNLEDFYFLFSTNMRDLGSPVHSRRWIKNILEAYGEQAKLGLVYLGELAVGGGILLFTSKAIAIPWASTLRSHNNLSPNMLLYWKFLEYAANHGFEHFDFGRSTPEEGTYKFKSQWGASPVPLKWHTIWFAGKPDSSTEASSGRREMAADLWRKLPLPLANILGPPLRKYISL